MKLHYYLITAILLLSINSFSQTIEKENSTNEVAGMKKSTKISQKPHSVSYPSPKNDDGYMGKKSDILEKLISNEIPKSLPKYKEGTPAEEYILLVKSWAKNNQELLKEKYRKNNFSSKK